MEQLTKREHEVMCLVCEGLTAQGIGERLNLSSRTVEIHRSSAIRKLDARNQAHAAVLFDRTHTERDTKPRIITRAEMAAHYAPLVELYERLKRAEQDTLADSDGDDGA